MQHANNVYRKTARETAAPRELEAMLLLEAAAKLQEAHDCWREKPAGLSEALAYNRQLWVILIDAVTREDNKLPIKVRDNLIKIGAFVMGELFALMTKPKPDHLKTIIKINRSIATGLRSKA